MAEKREGGGGRPEPEAAAWWPRGEPRGVQARREQGLTSVRKGSPAARGKPPRAQPQKQKEPSGVNARLGGAAAHRHESVQRRPPAGRTGGQAKKPDTTQESNWESRLWGRPSKEGGPSTEAWGAHSPAGRKVTLKVRAFPSQPGSRGRPPRAGRSGLKGVRTSSLRTVPSSSERGRAGRAGTGGRKGLRRAHSQV